MIILHRLLWFGVLYTIFVSLLFGFSSADGSWAGSEGVLLTGGEQGAVQYDEYIEDTDIFTLLDRMAHTSLSPNISMHLFEAKPGAILSPDAILPVPEVIFVMEGAANVTADEEQMLANTGAALYIPAHKTRKFETAGNETLRFFSIIDWDSAEESENLTDANNTTNPTRDDILVMSEDTVAPNIFGNTSSNEAYTFYRLLHPLEGPYNISYDMGTILLANGSVIPDHYIEDRYQLITILSGAGNISVGCVVHPVYQGDMMYAAPGSVLNISANEDMHMMMMTNPFYQAQYDRPIPNACDLIM